MMQYPTRPWSAIETFYTRLVYDSGWTSHQPMLDLVRFIIHSPYAGGLFPITSMATLKIGHYPDFIAGDGELAVSFVPRKNAFEFAYSPQPFTRQRWTRSYPAPEGQAALIRFLHRYARWFAYSG